MSIKQFMAVICAASIPFIAVFADDAKPQVAAEATKAAAPKFNPEELLALIPEFVGEYVDGEKVVKVDTAVLKKGLKAELDMAARQGADVKPEMIKQMIPRIGEQLVMQKVLPLAAAKAGFKPDLQKIRDDLAEFKKNQLKGNEEQFKQFLKAQGVETEEELIQKVAPNQAIQAYIKSIEDEVTKLIDDAAVKAYFEAHPEDKKYYFCSHILAAFNPENPREKGTPEQEAAALKKINEINAKLKGGAKFEDLAREHSDCPSGKQANGKLDGTYNPDEKMPKGVMVPEFTDAFNALKPGETTAEPVKTQFGYHLIRASEVYERKIEDVDAEIRNALKNEGMQKRIPSLLESIKKDFQVKVYEVK